MKKVNYLFVKASILLISASCLITSCKRETPIHKKAFIVNGKTWTRISPTQPLPITVNGTSYITLANVVGGGTGSANYIGEVNNYSNLLAYGTSAELPPVAGVGAPVVDIPGYPILGGPLPLIQAGDFAALPALIRSLNIPSNVQGKVVNNVIFNTNGDAIFFSNITGTEGSTYISETITGFSGESLIVGGSGRFKRAQGEIKYNGYFNMADPNDNQYKYEGWISF